jgi:propionyl-CoA carboxylase alpha chain
VSGDFNTGFIAEHYGKGFRAEDVPHDDPDFLVALAAATYRLYRERAAGISGQLPGHGVQIGQQFVVVVKGRAGVHRHVPVVVQMRGQTGGLASLTVTVQGRRPMPSAPTGRSAASARRAAATAMPSPPRWSARACGCGWRTTAWPSTPR